MTPLTLDEIVAAIGGRVSSAPAEQHRRGSAFQGVTVTGVSTDSRRCARGDLFFALRGARHDGHDHVDEALAGGAVGVVVDFPQIAAGRPAVLVRDTLEALGRLAYFHRMRWPTKIVAVTGSNGKTTTKGMIHHVLSRRLRGQAAPKSYNNAVGVPLTLLSVEAEDAYVVVEIGTNAPGEVATLAKIARPDVGVVTSIGDAHLEGLIDRNGVAKEKLSLFDHVMEGGLCVLNLDDAEEVPAARRTYRDHGRALVTFGTCPSADVRVSDVTVGVEGTSLAINGRDRVTLRCAGRHNALNAAAAVAVCRRLRFETEEIIEALSTFEPPPMRLNVARIGGLTLIDDSYNANPTSTRAALDVLKTAPGRRRVFVGGEMLELGGQSAVLHERAGRQIAEAGIDLLVAIGAHGPDVIRGAYSVCHRLTTLLYADTETACGDLPNWLKETDAILVKGSRRLELDRVACSVRAAFA